MAAQPSEQSPWPSRTPGPSTSYSSPKQKRRRADTARRRPGPSISPRQTADTAAIEQAKNQCEVFSGNQIISCFPTSNTSVAQHDFAGFVWNSLRPQLTQSNSVDIYLFHADSLKQVLFFPSVQNPTEQAGYITALVNDTWFGARGLQWNGTNMSMTFYWVLTRSGQGLDGSEIPQTTFTAVQTTVLDSVSSSLASSASAASMSSASAASASSHSNPSSNPGGIQSADNGSSFPHWAIAVIVVLGFFALVALCILAFFFITRRLRRRSESSNRSSMGSASPMMGDMHTTSPRSPLLGGPGLAAAGAGATGSDRHRPSSVASPDAASSISHGGSAGEGPFSGADAAIMADAFRKALRKPDFADNPVEEGEGGSQQPSNGRLLNRELAEEGRDIRRVESSRGVQVETLRDTGETAKDH